MRILIAFITLVFSSMASAAKVTVVNYDSLVFRKNSVSESIDISVATATRSNSSLNKQIAPGKYSEVLKRGDVGNRSRSLLILNDKIVIKEETLRDVGLTVGDALKLSTDKETLIDCKIKIITSDLMECTEVRYHSQASD